MEVLETYPKVELKTNIEEYFECPYCHTNVDIFNEDAIQKCGRCGKKVELVNTSKIINLLTQPQISQLNDKITGWINNQNEQIKLKELEQLKALMVKYPEEVKKYDSQLFFNFMR